jgi:excisionase family DNA binding protein
MVRMMPREIAGLIMYDLKEIAEILDVSNSTLLEYIKKGKLKAKKIGEKYLIEDKNLREFLEKADAEQELKEEGS